MAKMINFVSILMSALIMALMVTVFGLFSLSLVTGSPLGRSFSNTQMVTVFFTTGFLVSIFSWIVILGTNTPTRTS